MKWRYTVSSLGFLLTSAVNPAYIGGCGEQASKFEYGAEQMEDLLDVASDSYPFTHGGKSYRVELDLERNAQIARRPSLFSTPAHACESRNFMATASACYDSSRMEISGTMTVVEEGVAGDDVIASGVDVMGDLTVTGLRLVDGQIVLQFDEGGLELVSDDAKTFKLLAFGAKSLGGNEIDLSN